MISRRDLLKMGLASFAAMLLPARGKEIINAIAQSPGAFTIRQAAAPYPTWPMQTLLPGKWLPQWKDPLPDLTKGIQVVPGDAGPIELQMREFQYNVLPANFVLPNKTRYAGTWVWGYRQPDQPDGPTANSFIGPVIIAKRGTPTEIKYVNLLPTGATTQVPAYRYSTDLTLHWADPLKQGMFMPMDPATGMVPSPDSPWAMNYQGPIPAVPHLHGGEVPALIDGSPDSWFTSDGQIQGKAFYSKDGSMSNYCVYRYPNQQEPALIWFHDHTLGATRVNVYCGLAGAYLLTDPDLTLPPGLSGMPTIPLVIQDRSFDTLGQFLLPAGPPNNPNPDHPYWVPEFVGDSILVNGKLWPYVNVEPKRYRFLIINGSNARTYEMFLTNTATKAMGPAMWQIGTDGGYLDTAVKIDPNATKGQLQRLVIMPGERADVIIDFSTQAGQTLILKNVAKTPYPGGTAPDGNTVGKIIQFRVGPKAVADASFNPAVTSAIRPTPIIRLTSPLLIRQLTLNEIMGMPVSAIDPVTGTPNTAFPGGPLEILVNNTKWSGRMHMGMPRDDFTPDTNLDVLLSELPEEGTTEQWEIVNLTMDAHPIHLHLVQFQLMNRQPFDLTKYTAAYNAAFPGSMMIDPMTGLPYPPGAYIPAFGPPQNYDPTKNPLSGGKYGGNPDVLPFLKNQILPPAPNENGWKDTIQCPPGMVTRFLVRFAPTDTPLDGQGHYPFDPSNAEGADYVWHCHIIDHEDNEMMRPYTVQPCKDVDRTYTKGDDY